MDLILAIVPFISSIALLLYCYIFLLRHKADLKNPKIINKIGCIYEEVKEDNTPSILYNALFFLHRVALALILTLLDSNTTA